MSRSNTLGEYLRARRELVDPADAGLRVLGVRRTPGLRREEVATLAGISADYYLRVSLSAARPRAPRRPSREVVPVGIRHLLDVLGLPAAVESRRFDVLAANKLATALSPNIRPGQNRLRSVFLDEAERDLIPDWEQALAGFVNGDSLRSYWPNVKRLTTRELSGVWEQQPPQLA